MNRVSALVLLLAAWPALASAAPTAVIAEPQMPYEQLYVVLDGSGSTGQIVRYEWDLDGDGEYDDATGKLVSSGWNDDGVVNVGLRVTDGTGMTDVARRDITVLNLSPYLAWDHGNIPVHPELYLTTDDYGSGYLSLSWIVYDNDPITVTVDPGDGMPQEDPYIMPWGNETYGIDILHSYEPGLYDMTVTVCDDDGGCTSILIHVHAWMFDADTIVPLPQTVYTFVNEPVTVFLTSQPQNEIFFDITAPASGSLDVAPGSTVRVDYDDPVSIAMGCPVVYTPERGFIGSDSFQFKARLSDQLVHNGATATITIVVLSHAPTALAGDDQVIVEGEKVILSAAGSSDPDGDALTFAWTQLAGPEVTLTGDGTTNPSFQAPAVGEGGAELTFQLTVKDPSGNSATDEVIVHVKDVPPVLTPPDCSLAQAVPGRIWPPNHMMVPVAITGVSDSQGSPIAITFTSVTQDESTDDTGDGAFAPDATLAGGKLAVRAERSGNGDGRVYHVHFQATSPSGVCLGEVTVSVPKSAKAEAVDSSPSSWNSL